MKFKRGDRVVLKSGEYLGVPVGSIGVVRDCNDGPVISVEFTGVSKHYRSITVIGYDSQYEHYTKLAQVLE